MVDYVQKLRDDLVEQFKGKPVIDALMEAVGDELNEVRPVSYTHLTLPTT